MAYIPKPIDTSKIVLSQEIAELTEYLAENIHEVWAKKRIDEGWTYGESRDNTLKKTPCLVPYKNLPESEKNFDRCMAMETIKLISTLGYKITKK